MASNLNCYIYWLCSVYVSPAPIMYVHLSSVRYSVARDRPMPTVLYTPWSISSTTIEAVRMDSRHVMPLIHLCLPHWYHWCSVAVISQSLCIYGLSYIPIVEYIWDCIIQVIY